MSRPSLLIAHPWMARGGSEATAMWTLQALQDDYTITFATAAPMKAKDWDELNRSYGTAVDGAAFEVLEAPKLPGATGPRKLSHLQVRYFEKFCHGIAKRFDLCISVYNPLWFGRPGIQLIGDFSFSEEMRRRLHAHGKPALRHRGSLLRKLYLGMGKYIGIERPPLRERGDLVLANSAWAERILSEHFSLDHSDILYPPVPLPTMEEGTVQRSPFAFASLGRIVPEKEIERVVHILSQVRNSGFPVTLTIAGNFAESEYSRNLGEWASAQGDWITMPGFLDAEGKRQVLSTHAFALHACSIEAFGIAVAEMAAMGCIPFVPSSGGAVEIVPFPELHYGSENEAVRRITRMLKEPQRIRELSSIMPEQAARFAPEHFVDQLREKVANFLNPIGISTKKMEVSSREHCTLSVE